MQSRPKLSAVASTLSSRTLTTVHRHSPARCSSAALAVNVFNDALLSPREVSLFYLVTGSDGLTENLLSTDSRGAPP